MVVKSFSEELSLYIRTGAPLIYVSALEVERAVLTIQTLCKDIASAPECKIWRNTTGWDGNNENLADEVPEQIDEFEENTICVLVNFHWYLAGDAADPVKIQKFIDGYYSWKGDNPKTVILLSPEYKIAPELDRLFISMTYPLPSREQLRDTLDSVIEGQEGQVPTPDEETTEKVLDAAAGLTEDEFENAVTLSILMNDDRKVDPKVVMDEKARTLTKSGMLDYWQNMDDMESVGGMAELKKWLAKRKKALGKSARDFGLPYPKGMMLLGIPGTGKSLVAKCVAKDWDLQLIRFDLGKVFGSLVGQSEERMRMVLAQVEALAPCVLWIDEAEKGLAGAGNTSSTDSGVTKRIFGSLISWMQERPKDKLIYMVMTVNDVGSLPPELLRKGRFDEIFWVDLPNDDERVDILRIHLDKRGRMTPTLKKDLESVSKAASQFSGAELEVAIEDSMFTAFDENRKELVAADLIASIKDTVPLAVTRESEITLMREWAKTRTKPAQAKPKTGSRRTGKRVMKL